MPRALLIIGACLALLVTGCGDDSSTTAEPSATTTEEQAAPSATSEKKSFAEKATEEAKKKTKPKISVPKGAPPAKLVVKDLEEGSGPTVEAGDEVSVHYVGVDYENGQQFDASWDRGEPIVFELGSGVVIPGWEKGVAGMKVGGRRELIIPPHLAYGPQDGGGTLVFVVDLLAVN